jgi:short-subunit dehydrogenase
MFDLVGKSVLIAGASRGIGRSVPVCMAEAGADVILWRRDRNALAKTQIQVNALGVKSSVAAFNVTERTSVMKVTADPIASQGKVEGAVVNAGINKLKSFLEWTPGE